jgi:hypothetical protein
MNILCKMFGHKSPRYAKKGWWSPGEEYGRVRVGATDGTGRTHGIVVGDCARCGAEFNVVRIHIPKVST